MQIEDKDIKQKNCVIFFSSNLVRWWSNFPLMFSADLGRWKVENNLCQNNYFLAALS